MVRSQKQRVAAHRTHLDHLVFPKALKATRERTQETIEENFADAVLVAVLRA